VFAFSGMVATRHSAFHATWSCPVVMQFCEKRVLDSWSGQSPARRCWRYLAKLKPLDEDLPRIESLSAEPVEL
jgi:hypothetical protein